jgi:hypothetical protein
VGFHPFSGIRAIVAGQILQKQPYIRKGCRINNQNLIAAINTSKAIRFGA